MKLTILVDNNTFIDRYYYGEPAVSYLVESEGKRILFDTGYSDVLIRNAELLGVDLKTVDCIAIYRSVPDHTVSRDIRKSAPGRGVPSATEEVRYDLRRSFRNGTVFRVSRSTGTEDRHR